MTDYTDKFGLVKPADPNDRTFKRPKPQPAARPMKTLSISLGRSLSLALKSAKKSGGR